MDVDVKDFTRSIARKVRLIEIYTNKAVTEVLAGEYSSVFKGTGIEFEEVREYEPGDEIRSIDWNVTARMGRPFVKRYVEERELTVWLLVDLSASGRFGSRSQLKNEAAAEFCALLAFAAIRNNDKVGMIVFTDGVELSIAPAKGRRHVLRLIRELLRFQPKGVGTDLSAALEYLGKVTHKRGVVFLVSDFLTSVPLAENSGKELRILARRHDLIAVAIGDARENELPDVGLVELEDPETGQRLLLDTSSRRVREEYARRAFNRIENRRALFQASGIDEVQIEAGRDYVRDLRALFRKRSNRR
ncbi:MAG: DUF58 domain-containing protein [Bryobacterales bacterium]|nr:DUF58 domain-containing protein [Bryobacterales bacterium]